MKKCTVCKEMLDYSHYHKLKISKDGYGYRCKKCDLAARHKYKEANRDRFRLLNRQQNLRIKFGMELEDYDKLLKDQDYSCAICKSPESYGVSTRGYSHAFSVDHCHETGKVRGLLCNNCNRGLGLLGDNLESIQKVVEYLKKTEDVH